jgi:hypothetical protein
MRSELTRGAQPNNITRIKWPSLTSRMQQAYDDQYSTFSIPARLWRMAGKIRAEREDIHKFTKGVTNSQIPLLPLRSSLTLVKGIIYAIWCTKEKKLYVGQTINNALSRFKEHIYKANSGDDLPLYKAMRKYGVGAFYIFPLERVLFEDDIDSNKREANFRAEATDREKFWMNLLRTWKPLGYNTVWSRRRQRCRHSKRNPVKRHRQTHVADTILEVLDKRVYAYRSWERRCKHLLHKIRSNAWEADTLAKYKTKNLRAMRDLLQRCLNLNYIWAPYTVPDAQTLLEKIRAQCMIPQFRRKREPKIKDPIILRVEWNDSMLRSVPVRRIILEAAGLPTNFPRESLTRLLVAKKLIKKLGDVVCNHKKAARSCESYTEPTDQCPCRKIFGAQYRPNSGCVLSMDPSISPCDKLRDLLKEGAGYRENIRSNITEALNTGLDGLIGKLAKGFAIPPTQFYEWKKNIMNTIQPLLSTPPKERSAVMEPDVRTALNFLRRHLVIGVTDKAPKNFVFICRNHYKSVLHTELQKEDGAYRTTNLSNEAIYNKFARELHSPNAQIPEKVKKALKKTKPADIHIPIIYWLPKMHKQPAKARFIAASADVLTTPLATCINDMLGFIKDELVRKDIQHIIKTGVKRCWFVDNHDKVCRWLKILPRTNDTTSRSIDSYDFSTMYTTLDLDDLVTSVHGAIQEAFQGHLCLLYHNKKNCRWIDTEADKKKQKPNHLYTADQITHLVRVLVQNTFIKNGSITKQQILGLPMGTNPAPHIADLVCYYKESTAMDRLMTTNIELARKFIGTFRLIDDILSIDNPDFAKHVLLAGVSNNIPDPIYPSFLELNKTNESSKSVTYLGMNISSTNSGFRIKVAPCDKKFPYPKINYPSLLGNFPKVLGYGVFTGQLHRFASICTTSRDFMDSTIKTSQLLLNKGYKRSLLYKKLDSYMHTNNFPYKTRLSTLSGAYKRVLS